MHTMHRILATALAPRKHSSVPAGAATTHPAVDCRPYGTSGHLTSSPWEGLYLELND